MGKRGVMHADARLNRRFVEFAKLLQIYLNHWPRHEKYGLSQLVRATAYELFDYITEAQKRYYKKTTLTNLDIAHERLRMQLWLAYELGYFRFSDGAPTERSPHEIEGQRYAAISRHVDEIGCMIGGWIKAEQSKGDAS